MDIINIEQKTVDICFRRNIFPLKHAYVIRHTSYVMLDGNSICLKLSSKIEQTAPKKWLEKNYNEYEFQLHIIDIENFNVENFNFSGTTTLTIEKENSNYKVTIKFENNCIATCQAKNITVANITAYNNDGAV